MTCETCNTVHNDLEECDGPWCSVCGMEAVDEFGDVCDDCAQDAPQCDICGERDAEGGPDWNGETGRHYSCEAEATALPIWPAGRDDEGMI